MKSKFASTWNSSVQRRKQHKYRHNAPLHIRHKFLSAHLSKQLQEKHGKRSLPLRKGDEVLVMRGSFKKKQAKVLSVNHKFLRVYLEGIQRSKKDGTKVNVPFNPRVLLITTIGSDDKMRFSKQSDDKKAEKKEIKVQEKSASGVKAKNASN